MGIPFLHDIDLKQNELLQAVIHKSTSGTRPATPVQGQITFDTSSNSIYVYNGSSWAQVDATAHTQNTDTGTTQGIFTINSLGNYMALSSSGQTAPHQFTFPNASCQLANNADVTANAGAISTLQGSSHTQGTDTGTTSSSFILDSDGTFTGTLSLDTLTASRTYTLPDKSGTVAMISDVTAASHTQNTDTGTTAASFIINSGGNSGTIGTALLSGAKSFALPDQNGTFALLSGTAISETTSASFNIGNTGLQAVLSTVNISGSNKTFLFPNVGGTLALTSDLHTQNSDTGTTQTSFVINSGGNSATLATSTLTGAHSYELPDADGTIALLSDISAAVHTQGTDIGTTAASFQINSDGAGTAGDSIATLSTSGLDGNKTYTFPPTAGELQINGVINGTTLSFNSGGNVLTLSGVPTGSNTLTVPDETGTLISSATTSYTELIAAKHDQNTDTGTTSTSFIIDSANGSGFTATIQPTTLTAARTYTLPDASGTVALTSDLGSLHTQNSDTGTTSATFDIDSDGGALVGVRLKASSGELQARNLADDDFADFRCKNLVVEGTTTTVNSNEVNIGDAEILLNSDNVLNSTNSDGGIAVKRLQSDDTTRADAKVVFNNSQGKWQVVNGAVDDLQTHYVARKFTFTAQGNDVATSFVVTHNMNSLDVAVAVRDVTNAQQVMVDVALTSVDSITVGFKKAPATGEDYTVTVIG